MKRFLPYLVIIFSIAAGFTGCGGAPAPGDDGPTPLPALEGGGGGSDQPGGNGENHRPDSETAVWPKTDRLFIITTKFGRRMADSFLQTDTGWREYAIPCPMRGTVPEFGPAFFLGGRTGYGVWNYARPYGMNVYATVSMGHVWLAFDPDSGWSVDRTHREAGALRNIDKLFAVSEKTFWTSSVFWIATRSPDYPSLDFRLQQNSLFVSENKAASRLLTYTTYEIASVSFADEDFGYVAVRPLVGQNAFLLKYDQGDWAVEMMPASCWGGTFAQVQLVNRKKGYAIAECGSKNVLFTWDGATWEPADIPQPCAFMTPKSVTASEDIAVVPADLGKDYGGFWMHRDGAWTCRAFQYEFMDRALILANGRVFGAGHYVGDDEAHLLFEITKDQVFFIDPPEGAGSIAGLYAVGPDAPKYSKEN